ncbi:Protein of unknown function [Pyronema omphalodes CBS 100304]|uniref:Uncharacterized protein n=1 Tax=Pyronema omphalodes (strain CBS 100304) TaxID=1076935 RepID=U4L1T5_PYROM|nr:Protein of unknown function [Pyronema omphalodes CBS 100304]
MVAGRCVAPREDGFDTTAGAPNRCGCQREHQTLDLGFCSNFFLPRFFPPLGGLPLIQISTSSSASLGHTSLKPLPPPRSSNFRNPRSQQQSNQSTRSRLRPNPPHVQLRIHDHHSGCDGSNDSFTGTYVHGLLCVVVVP